MKTFEEALQMLYVVVRDQEVIKTEPGFQEAIAPLMDTNKRYQGFCDDCANSRRFDGLLAAWMEHAAEENVESALFTAFISGLVVGMEMEKQHETE